MQQVRKCIVGTKIDLTVASGGTAHSFVGGTATATATLGLGVDGDDNRRDIAHVGWVKKTVGTGGRVVNSLRNSSYIVYVW